MSKRVALLSLLLVAHATVTGIAVYQHGFMKTLLAPFESTATLQVFSDLCVALLLVSSWVARDCKSNGRSFAPWFVLTLATGSFAPLGYLLLRERTRGADPR